jgi:hypothetical protein
LTTNWIDDGWEAHEVDAAAGVAEQAVHGGAMPHDEADVDFFEAAAQQVIHGSELAQRHVDGPFHVIHHVNRLHALLGEIPLFTYRDV